MWSGVTKEAGSYSIKWDGTDDFQQPLPNDNYLVKVLSNNVSYNWEGIIGNSSTSQTGNSIHRSLDPAIGMVIASGNAYYCIGYGEGQGGNGMFALNNIQVKLHPMPYDNTGQNTDFMVTDGTNIYWAGYDAFQPTHSFVFATKVSDKSEATFSYGKVVPVKYAHTYTSAIGYEDAHDAFITGLAVSDNFIFISRKNLNEVRVLDKITGAVVQKLAFTSPTAMASKGNTLWLCTAGNKVEKCIINSNGTLLSTGIIATGFSAPITMSTNGSLVALVDGADSQQVKAFDFTSGVASWTLGQPNGNNIIPTISNDRFAFWKRDQETAEKVGFGAVAFAEDGSFWVCDPSNFRMQHYSSDRRFIDRIEYTGRSYNLAVDLSNPSRVLNTMQEYEVNYTNPIKNSWVHKYNWDGTYNTAYDLLYKVRHICTLSNGRTYAIMKRKSDGLAEVVELDTAKGIRYTGLTFESTAKIYADGSIGEMQNGGVNEIQYFKKRLLLGFDANNPIYSQANGIATHSNTSTNEPRNGSITIYPTEITSTGILALYKGSRVRNETNSYHLGGLDIATGKVKWKTALSNFDAYEGAFPDNGDFEVGNFGPNEGGQGDAALAIGRSIITHYYGEFWKAGQTNIFNHYYDNGLFVGQFGTTSDDVTQPADVKMAGNAFSPVIVPIGPDYYLYHNDESHHGGTHRWKITGLNSIQEQTIPISTSFQRGDETPVLPGIDLMAGLPYRSSLADNTSGWTRNPASDAAGWNAKTNVKTYSKRKSPDLYITYSQEAGAYTIKRDLGTNNNLSSWRLFGKVNYDNCMPNTSIGVYLDVLDDNGKIIIRFYNSIDYSASPITVNVYANNTLISSGPEATVKNITKRFQLLDISMVAGAISVGYAGSEPVKVGSYDLAANTGSPKTMQLYFTNSGGPAYGKVIGLDEFRFVPSNNTINTPIAPTLAADDVANTLVASHTIGDTAIVVSENGSAFVQYLGKISVNNLARPSGYWKFKIKAATMRNESAVVSSPEFTISNTINITTPAAPIIVIDNTIMTLKASHPLGDSVILVSENGGPYLPYIGQISVGNVVKPEGYWKFKVKSGLQRNESAVINSPELNATTSPTTNTPAAPTVIGNDVTKVLSASHSLGDSVILVCENGGPYLLYTGQINVGNVSRPVGYWKFKIKAGIGRNESGISESPAFSTTIQNVTPTPPIITIDDINNMVTASHVLGSSEIIVSANGSDFVQYPGPITVGNVNREAGYYKFKIKAVPGRNESVLASSPAFTINTSISTPAAPILKADDAANTLDASHDLGNTEIVVSENGGAFVGFVGLISVGDISRPAGYWKFKIKSARDRNESAIAVSPEFTVKSIPSFTPDAPTVVGNDSTDLLSASHLLGASEIVVSENGSAFAPYTGSVNVGNVSRPLGYWKFKIKSGQNRNESAVAASPEFTIASISSITPDAPALVGDDIANVLSASHSLGISEILVSENGSAFTAYTGSINVGNTSRSAGYWRFKIRAGLQRNESIVASSPEFTTTTTPDAPIINGDDVANTLTAIHTLGSTEILVSENGGVYAAYAGPINVGNVSRPNGYWKFKIKAGLQRNESIVANSPVFTVTTTPDAPVVVGDDVANVLTVSHRLGNSEILVSENGGIFAAYLGPISVGNVSKPTGYWKFKIKAALQRNESAVVNSPEFTTTVTPLAPEVLADDIANTLVATHALGTSEIVVSENGGVFSTYIGTINVGNVSRPAGYWRFKIKATLQRNESIVVTSPAFTITTTPVAPTLSADDAANTLTAFHSLGTNEILVSVNGGPFTTFTGMINVGNVSRPLGYWRFKVKAALQRTESSIVSSPPFTINSSIAVPNVNSIILSVQLTALKATQVDKDVLVQWATTAELDVERYEVEGSFNSRQFASVGTVPARGSAISSNYNFLDKSPFPGDNYYRIKTVYKSGEVHFSSVVYVRFVTGNGNVSVYPNPIISNNIFIQSSNLAKGEYTVSLVTSTGQTILNEIITHAGGIFSHSIPLSPALSKGTYILKFFNKEFIITKQLIK
ncbi:hypothetical protein SAE01_29430 [Segetibacter aerophilus]|uniref:Secretion system C-terminal sorting domain-containing protein n=1 Tax=Segetibacter aerophilus TaxID=670293 RepID=A0A512BF36_9BACT|nr:hypothetical protein SAE01_29430 [Segetibacter aerophilus]